mmetsp:Transcript_73884/g.203905  ORF Transcript_73884/g.203905 Transcript_73884/m.203905 type:complete len:448 (-) Transcript_73884:32-1375(-)
MISPGRTGRLSCAAPPSPLRMLRRVLCHLKTSTVKSLHSMHTSASRAISSKRSHGVLGRAMGKLYVTPPASTAKASSCTLTMMPCRQWCRRSLGWKRKSFSPSERWTHHCPPFSAMPVSSISARKAPSHSFPHSSSPVQRERQPEMAFRPAALAVAIGRSRARPVPALVSPWAMPVGVAANAARSEPLHTRSRPRTLPSPQRARWNACVAAASALPSFFCERRRSQTQATRQHCTARTSALASAALCIRGTPPGSQRPQTVCCRPLPSTRAAKNSTRHVVVRMLRHAQSITTPRSSPAMCACGAGRAWTRDTAERTTASEDLCASSSSSALTSLQEHVKATVPQAVTKVPSRKTMPDAAVPLTFSQNIAATLPAKPMLASPTLMPSTRNSKATKRLWRADLCSSRAMRRVLNSLFTFCWAGDASDELLRVKSEGKLYMQPARGMMRY